MLSCYKEKPLGYKFKIINEAAESAVNNSLKYYGLTFSQIHMLLFLDDNCSGRPVKMKDIEDYFNLKHPTVTGIIERLKAKGFVTTYTDPSDRRCTLVAISDRAAEVRYIMDVHHKTMDAIFENNISESDLRLLSKLLDQIIDNLISSVKFTMVNQQPRKQRGM
jgi:DNA-binding MarR family transcriptional regulator